MSYPGNDSLSQELRERILHTFRQALTLTEEGNDREAGLGCDFILHLDPLFEAARTLQSRLDAGETEVADLRAALEAWGAKVEGGDAPAAELGPESPASAAGQEDPLPEAEPSAAPAPDSDDDFQLTDFEPELEAAQPSEATTSPAVTPSSAEPATPEEPVEAAPSVDDSPASEPPPPVDDSPASEPPPTEAPAATQSISPPPTPPASDIDALSGEPAAALDHESERRVVELLGEGQEAFDRVEYQAAIDAWSRIFLIDIDHPEANRRIELARKLKAEVERTIEELYHEGISQVERGDLEGAKASFTEILELQPSHLQAREYLDRLESDPPPAPAPAAAKPAATTSSAPVQPAAATPGAPAPTKPPTGGDDQLSAPDLPPIAPSVPRSAVDDRRSFSAAPVQVPRKKLFLSLGAAVLAIVLAVGWYLWSNWDRTFPNAQDGLPTTAAEALDPVTRAKELHAGGKTSIAIAQLRRLPPDATGYAEAQALIAEWERPAGAEGDEVNQEALARERQVERERLLARARKAAGDGDNLLALDLLNEASSIAPLAGEEEALAATVNEDLEPIAAQVEIFRQGEWEIALRNLWRIREQLPDDPDLQRLMVDSYYNLGVRDLQRGDLEAAAGHFSEARGLDTGDPEIERLNRFAATYRERPEDLLYRIFVKYLPFR